MSLNERNGRWFRECARCCHGVVVEEAPIAEGSGDEGGELVYVGCYARACRSAGHCGGKKEGMEETLRKGYLSWLASLLSS